jgi:hypothetical protein
MTIYKQIHLFASIQLVEYLVSSFRPMLYILCNITLLIVVHMHVHWYNRSITIIVMLIHGLHIDTSIKAFWSILLKVHGTICLNQIWYWIDELPWSVIRD